MYFHCKKGTCSCLNTSTNVFDGKFKTYTIVVSGFFPESTLFQFTRTPYVTCLVVIYRLCMQIYFLLVYRFMKWKQGGVFLSGSTYRQAKVLFGFWVRIHLSKDWYVGYIYTIFYFFFIEFCYRFRFPGDSWTGEGKHRFLWHQHTAIFVLQYHLIRGIDHVSTYNIFILFIVTKEIKYFNRDCI